ncbi:hypothetical protein GCM10022267_38890 [Lentzea roselyniae]|uniref:Secreted protein n=1 Tax=Lentzea roselyniae TaxID=531940 RepID=A0ABP7B5Y6_9PSEU
MFLQARSTAPIAATILGCLVVLSVQENDPQQAGTLEPDGEGQDHAARIADSLRRDQAALDDVPHRTSQSPPLTPHHE